MIRSSISCRYSHKCALLGDVSDHRCPCSDNNVTADRYVIFYCSTCSYMSQFTHQHSAAQGRIRGNMYIIAYPVIMLDYRTCIYDTMSADNSRGIDDRIRHYSSSLAYMGIYCQLCRRMDSGIPPGIYSFSYLFTDQIIADADNKEAFISIPGILIHSAQIRITYDTFRKFRIIIKKSDKLVSAFDDYIGNDLCMAACAYNNNLFHRSTCPQSRKYP